MDFGGAGGIEDAAGIGAVDTATGQDDDAAGGLGDQLTEEGDAGLGSGLLARGKDAGTTQLDELFKGFSGLAATVESTMESDGTTIGGIYPPAGGIKVDVAIGSEGSHDDCIGTGMDDLAHLAFHLLYGRVIIDESPINRTDKDVDAQVGEPLANGADEGEVGGKTIQRQVTAELDTTGTTQNGLLHAVEGTGANLKERQSPAPRPHP